MIPRPSRRTFLRMLLATPLAATVDYEQLLWHPRAMITVPAIVSPTIAEINAVTMQKIYPGVIDNFFANDPLLAYLQDHERRTPLRP